MTAELFEVIATGEAFIRENGEVELNIIDTAQGAIRTYADLVTEGDSVFDFHGNAFKVGEPKRSRRHVTVRRSDGFLESWEFDDIVTIIPDGNAGREIDFHSPGSVQGYIETGRYSTVDEEREFNG